MKNPYFSKHSMLYREQEGNIGQLLPSIGPIWFLRILTKQAAAFAGLVVFCLLLSLASGLCHGLLIGSSRARAIPANAKTRKNRMILEPFTDKAKGDPQR
jgi:hypothetical protein